MNRQLRKELRAALACVDAVNQSFEELHDRAIEAEKTEQDPEKQAKASLFVQAVFGAASTLITAEQDVRRDLAPHIMEPRTKRKKGAKRRGRR